jgi:hypothetical protein
LINLKGASAAAGRCKRDVTDTDRWHGNRIPGNNGIVGPGSQQEFDANVGVHTIANRMPEPLEASWVGQAWAERHALKTIVLPHTAVALFCRASPFVAELLPDC